MRPRIHHHKDGRVTASYRVGCGFWSSPSPVFVAYWREELQRLDRCFPDAKAITLVGSGMAFMGLVR